MQRTFKYRLYPNRKQRGNLAAQLDMCRELYNAALQERIESYKTTGKGVTWLGQQSQLPAIKEVRPEFKNVHANTLQAVLIRPNRSFQNFFRRVKRGELPGFPRFKGRNRFNSLVFSPCAFKVEGNHVKLSKVGNVKIKLHRALPAVNPKGTSQTCLCGAQVRKFSIRPGTCLYGMRTGSTARFGQCSNNFTTG